MNGRQSPDTTVLHLGEGASAEASPLTTPIYTATTFVFQNAAELEAYQRGGSSKYIYSRYANPTVEAAEAKLAALEGGEAALVTASGMAATATALFGLLRAGDELVSSAAIYGGTLHLADELARFGITTRYVSLEHLARPESLCGPRTRVVWFESPVNPSLQCVDIARVSTACRAAGVTTILDNTFASPVNQQPLSLGVDVVMHSATKYLNGHSDVTAGALVGREAQIATLRGTRKLLGGVLDPASASLLARGMKTLAVRMSRHNENAMRVATWLARDPRVERVMYPGLASHPDHAVARRQMRGFGGMVAADLGSYAAACRAYDRLQVFQRAASLGGVESLCSLPVLTSQYGLSDEQLASAGITRGTIRLSVGLEDPDDLIADLDQALG